MKRGWKLLLSALALYLLLLVALVAAEGRSPNGSIRTLWDAVWFSLITMTTVGYGDLSPVTPAGRVLGLIFAMCSIGILTALIGIGLRLLGGQIIPSLRLRWGRRRRWYVFRDENEDAAALGRALRREDPGCLLVFPEGEEHRLAGSDVIRLNASPEQLRRLRGGGTDGCVLFYLGADLWQNYSRAFTASDTGFAVYCMTDVRADDLPANVHLFSRTEALGRSYWREHPLSKNEQCVALLGCGEAGSALLERAILTNVLPDRTGVEYHVFDDSAHFAALHGEIVRAMAPDNIDEDRLIFHAEDWREALDVLARADRIILCWDDDAENLAVSEAMRTWLSLPGEIHLRLHEPVPPLRSFGERERVITPELVMKAALDRQAVLINDLYNRGSASPVSWEAMGWFLRQSNIAAADHLMVKIRYLLDDDSLTDFSPALCRRAWERLQAIRNDEADTLQRAEHRRWMRFHWLYNWQYASARDNARRLHPLLVPYDALAPAERSKDMTPWEILGQLL